MAGGDEEQGDVQIGAMFYSVWVAPFPEEGYANVYGRDITERKWAEDALKEAHDELEKRVQERTTELTEAVQRLQAEILQRKQLEETLRESEKQVRLFATQCLTAQETERRRIAAELHDSTAASLAAIKFRIEKTREDIKKGLDVTESLQDLSSNVAESLGEVRRIMTDLRPSVLDDLGILPALNWFCREYQKTYSHISVEKQIGIEEHEVPEISENADLSYLSGSHEQYRQAQPGIPCQSGSSKGRGKDPVDCTGQRTGVRPGEGE